VCDVWGAGKAASIENQPISSAIPALVMAGEYDPVTPPAWAKRAAQTLPNSFYFEYPGIGHGASFDSGCAEDMVIAFINNPTKSPDQACIAKMSGPRFLVPGVVGDIKLEPYVNRDMGISGVVPDGWEEVAPGTVARMQSATDATLLFQLAANNTRSAAFALALLPRLGVEKLPTTSETRKTATLTWTIYRVKEATLGGQKVAFSIALADSDNKGIIVILMTAPADMEAMSTAVLTPVLEALKVVK
jgi:hypothetical protein